MKKIFFFNWVFIGILILSSCSSNDDYTNFQEEKIIPEASADKQWGANELINTLQGAFGATETRSLQSSDYPSYYGGNYINSDGKLVVLLAENVLENKNAIINILGNSDIIFEECNYSFSDLTNIKEYILNKHHDFVFSNVRMLYIDEKENEIVVGLKDCSPTMIDTFRKLVSDSPVIRFIEVSSIVFDSSIVAGDSIVRYRNGSLVGASVGYRAKDASGKNGIVTAGHFIGVGDTFMDKKTRATIGICRQSENQQGQLDAAFCEITNTDFIPSNEIAGSGGQLLSTVVSQPGTTTTINKYGYVTKRTSGTVVNHSVDIIINNVTLMRDVILANYHADEGDSGGIVYSYVSATNTRYTVGIHQGRATVRENGVLKEYSVVCKAYNINRIFKLTRY